MLSNDKLLFDELYEKTKDCSRVQIVKLLMTKERENKQLKINWNKLWQYILEKDNRGYEKVYTDDVLDEMKELQGSEN